MKNGKIFKFLSTLFQNKVFISQESPILADVENKYNCRKSIFEGDCHIFKNKKIGPRE